MIVLGFGVWSIVESTSSVERNLRERVGSCCNDSNMIERTHGDNDNDSSCHLDDF